MQKCERSRKAYLLFFLTHKALQRVLLPASSPCPSLGSFLAYIGHRPFEQERHPESQTPPNLILATCALSSYLSFTISTKSEATTASKPFKSFSKFNDREAILVVETRSKSPSGFLRQFLKAWTLLIHRF